MDTRELVMTALRALGVFVFMLIVIRLLGKRTVGNFTAFDFLVALMLGEVVDEIIYGDVGVAQGAVAILVIAGAKYMTSRLNLIPWLNALLEGKPRPVVEDGKIRHEALRAELMNELDLMSALRLQHIGDVKDVKIAVVETDGEVSVIKKGDEGDKGDEGTHTWSPRALGRP